MKKIKSIVLPLFIGLVTGTLLGTAMVFLEENNIA